MKKKNNVWVPTTLVCWTRNCARPTHSTPVLYSNHRAAIKLTKVKSHANNIRDIIVAHVISADGQTIAENVKQS